MPPPWGCTPAEAPGMNSHIAQPDAEGDSHPDELAGEPTGEELKVSADEYEAEPDGDDDGVEDIE